jgi:hypothetical protein
VFDSFKRLWVLYYELNWLLRLYVKLGPRERWLRKLTGLLAAAPAPLPSVFLQGQVFSGVYVWVSVLTSKLYVGSTVDLRQRVYSHVCSLRKQPKQNVHRFLRGFGKHLFFPVPLVSCPRGPLRHVEESIVGQLQPGLNREWMPVGGISRRANSLLRSSGKGHRVCAQRRGPRDGGAPSVCAATFLPGGLSVPSVPAALLHAYRMKVRSFTLHIEAGSVHLMLRQGLHRMFDNSVISVEGREELQNVSLGDCWGLLLKPIRHPLVLHVHKLAAVGWRLWAADTLSRLIRNPESRRDLYRLDQLSFVRLWRTAVQWDRPLEKRKLLQLVSAVCRKVHSVDLRLSLVLRVPYGLQGLHVQLAQSLKTMVLSECTVHPAVRRLWLESVKVV